MILDLAERDPALFRKLDIAAIAVSADDKTLETRLGKAIDGATRTRGFVDYREAAGWAADVDAALDAVAELAAAAGRAGLALKLIEQAINRIEHAGGEIDDSDGHCGALLERCLDIHLAAARAAGPEPVQLARDLFAREMEGEYGTFDSAAKRYAEVLGEPGLGEYRRLADAAWAELPPLSGRVSKSDLPAAAYHRLREILDFFAEREGDVDARVALRAKELTSPWSYLQLAEFCVSQGREEEALRRAEEGLWVFEDSRPDERLVSFAVGRLSKAGRNGDAEALLRRAFEKAPSLELYVRLGAFGGAVACDRALQFLRARLGKETPTPWLRPADLVVRILTHEKEFDLAWATVGEHGASAGVKEALARASEATHRREATEVYAERVDQLVDGGGAPAYAEAVELVARMAALRSATEQSAYATALKERFGRKRNFMKLLE